MRDFIITEAKSEEAVLVGLITRNQNEAQAKEYLDELDFLSRTAGVQPVERFIQRIDQPHAVTFVGKGKLEEIRQYVEEHEIGLVIFDDELTPKQLRNIEQVLKVKILDRTSLILDIFASRATTAYAKTQVELAQYRYMLPRLTRLWTHLERQRGGVGMRGPGETQLETDRRIIQDRIAHLKAELKVIDRQMSMQRKNRGKLVRVALVGYTNVGKSTLMNVLAKSEVFAENKLFATLDTTVRKVIVHNLPFLLSDTVGFIRKLPTEHIEVVTATLREITAGLDQPVFLVFNKIDAFTYEEKDADDLSERTQRNLSRSELEATWMAKLGEQGCVFISAKTGEGIEELKQLLYDRAKEIHVQRFPYNDFLFQDYSALAGEEEVSAP